MKMVLFRLTGSVVADNFREDDPKVDTDWACTTPTPFKAARDGVGILRARPEKSGLAANGTGMIQTGLGVTASEGTGTAWTPPV